MRLGLLRAFLLLMPALAAAQSAAETYTEPKLLVFDTSSFPHLEQTKDHEGWVQLEFMVDAQGKPFEISVVDSTGNASFEKAAAAALESARFQAGTVNGQPVESATRMTVNFLIPHIPRGADPEFFAADKTFLKAVNAKDRTAADEAFSKLVVANLYDDAYYGLAVYSYAYNWGTEQEQLAGLRRAIAGQHRSEFLKVREFRNVLAECIRLESDLHLYAEVLRDWAELKKTGADIATTSKLQPVIDQILALRNTATPYSVEGTLKEGWWNLGLFKSHFRVAVSEGHVSAIDLRCKKGYLRFTYDPDALYTVPDRLGDCHLTIEGDPGSHITLTQT